MKKESMELKEELPSEENMNKNINFELNINQTKEFMSKSYFERVTLKDITSNENFKKVEKDECKATGANEEITEYRNLDYFSTKTNTKNFKEEKIYENTIDLKKIDYPNIDLNEIIIKEKNFSLEYIECKYLIN